MAEGIEKDAQNTKWKYPNALNSSKCTEIHHITNKVPVEGRFSGPRVQLEPLEYQFYSGEIIIHFRRAK